MSKASLFAYPAVALLLAVSPGCKKDKDSGEGTETAATETPETAEDTTATETPPETPDEGEDTATMAVANMEAKSESKVSGTVTFTQKEDGGPVEVAISLEGLTPGDHGFHVHETGDCSAPDAKSAGGHFNPIKAEHGGPDSAEHHAGDFGNITAGDDGKVDTTVTVDFITLGEGETSVVGKAVVVHEKADDLKSQPSGDAGGRIGCGVIEIKQQ